MVALQFKLMGIENVTAVKESKFKKGLMRRIELICNFLNVSSGDVMSYLSVQPVFTRTKPINKKEEAERLQILTGIYSQETVLSLSSDISDVQGEIERINNEQKNLYEDNYSELGNEDNAQE